MLVSDIRIKISYGRFVIISLCCAFYTVAVWKFVIRQEREVLLDMVQFPPSSLWEGLL